MSENDRKAKVRPLGDKVLVRRIEHGERKTAGGVIIPGTVKDEKAIEGEVIAVGEGVRDDNGNLVPMPVKVGDRVLFKSWSSTSVRVEDEELMVVPASDLVAILEPTA